MEWTKAQQERFDALRQRELVAPLSAAEQAELDQLTRFLTETADQALQPAIERLQQEQAELETRLQQRQHEDEMTTHLQLAANGRLDGLTPRGWFHIRHLHLNRSQLVIWRLNQQRKQALQTALAAAEITNQQLQQRIRTLEQEVALLRQRIAHLTGEE